jgi:hypothetical protein
MARTPKRVRRNGGSCVCPDQDARFLEKDYENSFCKHGYCFVARCRACHGSMMEVGPVGCPCEGPPRWTRYPGMQQPGDWDFEADKWVKCRVALKPGSLKFRRLPAGRR